MGSNSDIIYNIGKVYGFEVAVNISNSFASYYDNKTGKWIGLAGSVRTSLSLKFIMIINLRTKFCLEMYIKQSIDKIYELIILVSHIHN